MLPKIKELKFIPNCWKASELSNSMDGKWPSKISFNKSGKLRWWVISNLNSSKVLIELICNFLPIWPLTSASLWYSSLGMNQIYLLLKSLPLFNLYLSLIKILDMLEMLLQPSLALKLSLIGFLTSWTLKIKDFNLSVVKITIEWANLSGREKSSWMLFLHTGKNHQKRQNLSWKT